MTEERADETTPDFALPTGKLFVLSFVMTLLLLGGFLIGLPPLLVIVGFMLGAVCIGALYGLRLGRQIKASGKGLEVFDQLAFQNGRGLYGFKVGTKEVGGGLYNKFDLRPNEKVIQSILASSASLLPGRESGYLTLTSERLAFTSSRLSIGKSVDEIELSSVRSVELARRINPRAPLVGLRQQALVIRLEMAATRTYWPAVANKVGFKAEIEKAARLNLG